MTRIELEALGNEIGKNLSHALNKVWLQLGFQGEGEVFILEQLPNNRVALACTGEETGKYLSHAFG
jgi:predicted CoA-binding protein